MTTIKEALNYYSNSLPHLELRIFLQKILNCTLEELILKPDYVLKQDEELILQDYCNRRNKHEPVAYIIESKEFFGLEFKVTKDVLIPRPETELIVEQILGLAASQKGEIAIADICTGSGCIGISLAYNLPKAFVVASDISNKAIMIAKENAKRHSVIERMSFVESNWFEGFDNLSSNKFDIICCNPPYIPESDINIMAKETHAFEPHLALFAKENGLLAYKMLAKNSGKYLKAKGYIIVECGYNQADKVSEIFFNEGLREVKRCKDISGFERCLVFS